MLANDDRQEGGERALVLYPPHFLDTFTGVLAAAGWQHSDDSRWHREKKVGRAQVREWVVLRRGASAAAHLLTGEYGYAIDSGSDYGVVYDEQAHLPTVPLVTTDPAQLAGTVLALSGRERRLLAARTAWMVGDAWPRLRDLALLPGWLNPVASSHWSVRWITLGDEWVVTTLDPNVEGEHPLLRYERQRGEQGDATIVASGALPLDPLADVGGTFAAFVAMIDMPERQP